MSRIGGSSIERGGERDRGNEKGREGGGRGRGKGGEGLDGQNEEGRGRGEGMGRGERYPNPSLVSG